MDLALEAGAIFASVLDPAFMALNTLRDEPWHLQSYLMGRRNLKMAA